MAAAAQHMDMLHRVDDSIALLDMLAQVQQLGHLQCVHASGGLLQ